MRFNIFKKQTRIIPEHSLLDAKRILKRIEELESPVDNAEINTRQAVIEDLENLIQRVQNLEETMIPINPGAIVTMRNAVDVLNSLEEPQTILGSITSFIIGLFHGERDSNRIDF